MTDIATFPTITAVCDRGHRFSGSYKAGATIKAGMVVAFALTGVSETVHPAIKGTTGTVAGVAAEDASTGEWFTVYEDGAVVYVANADGTTGIDAGAIVEVNDNAVGGTVSAVATAGTSGGEVSANVVGTVIEDIAGGSTGRMIIRILTLNAGVIDASYIVVSTQGNDSHGEGSFASPYLTITKALTMVTATRKTIFVLPGEYAEAALLTWPNINGVLIKGMDEDGNVVISNANAAAEVILINPTFTTASFEAFIENVCISHEDQIGLEIDNANMGTRKLLVHLTNVSFEMAGSTGDSINVTHTLTTQAIRLYMRRCDEVEGLVHVVVANADDRFRFMEGCVLIGGVTTAGAVAGEVSILHSVVLTGGWTIGSATQVVTTFASVYRTDAGVFSQLADGYSG